MTEPIHYRIRAVAGWQPDVAYRLMRLHQLSFGYTAPHIAVWNEYAWIATLDAEDVGFATLREDGYLTRAGVIAAHRGHGLQRRLITARVNKARTMGIKRVRSDTTDNPASAHSLARCGFTTYQPDKPWAFKTTLYWEKHL